MITFIWSNYKHHLAVCFELLAMIIFGSEWARRAESFALRRCRCVGSRERLERKADKDKVLGPPNYVITKVENACRSPDAP